MKIAVSTIAFIGTPITEVLNIAKENSLQIEFSSGLPYMENMEDIYLSSELERLPHNYFPAPKDPFVLNLASVNDAIRKRSISHCKRGLELAAASKSPFFAAHAGFCIDPRPEELGRKLSQGQDFYRPDNQKLFLESIREILEYSHILNVPFLVENNVVASMNLRPDGSNPLLCAEPGEILELVDTIQDENFGILLDTAHLKVSANTLSYDMDEAVVRLKDVIKGLHHSDNEGVFDSNDKCTEDYWFLKHIPLFTEAQHVLEIKKLNLAEIREHMALLEGAVR
ncbi:sugar phosphate isomerase/epimerase family protein [Leptospira sp. WS92.C1]